MFWYIWILLIFWWSFGVWEVWAGQVLVLHIPSSTGAGFCESQLSESFLENHKHRQVVLSTLWHGTERHTSERGRVPNRRERFIRMQGTSITSIFSKFLKEQHALFFCIIFVWLWLWESSENQQLTLWIYESMWHIPIDFKNWGPLSVQRFLSHVPSGRCEVVGAALKLRLVQKATMHWCMLRWFRSPASCSSAAWPHGGCSMGGASLEGTCG